MKLKFLVWLAVLVSGAWAQIFGQAAPALTLHPPLAMSNGWMRLTAENWSFNPPTESVLEISTNLVDWHTLAVLPGVLKWDPVDQWLPSNQVKFVYVDREAATRPARFYRSAVVAGRNDWRSQVFFGNDPFNAWSGEMQYVKFVIPADEPTRVIYFDREPYLFHYDFISTQLEGFKGLDFETVRRLTRFNEGRKLFIGSVLFPFGPDPEYGIQFDATDPLPPETVKALFELVRETVINGRETNAPTFWPVYVPSYEQTAAVMPHQAYFESNGIQLATITRWVVGDVCYSPGWAIGRLKFVPGTNLTAAYAADDLLPTDILLTDGVPAEVPYVAGIIALNPATPNSHAAILARSYELPFVYLCQAVDRERARQLEGREIVLRVAANAANFGWNVPVKFFELDAGIDPAFKRELMALKTAKPINFPAKERLGAYVASTDPLVPADSKYFGGKAANFGLLRRAIPTNSPAALAFSMDLWDDFMDQTLGNGVALRAEIASRLSGFHINPVDMAALTNVLAGVRDLIRRTAVFSPALRQVVTNALAGFSPTRKIRFRSSTNVEDSEAFSGAGLYDSYSGCLADDLDADGAGPCRCEAAEPNERGVFRALQRVYASFYNDNAYLVRLQQGIDEATVGMGVLVHYSTPDEIELANGVATVSREPAWSGGAHHDLEMVTQQGAVSVANPDGTAQPEVMRTYFADEECFVLKQPSSLLPLGSYVLDWQDFWTNDYVALGRMFTAVTEAYAALFPGKPNFTLDFEYKKEAPGHLQIKQVREVPTSDTTPSMAPFLLNEPLTLVTWQGIQTDLFTEHRLKSRFTFRTRNLRLTQTNVAQGILAELTWERGNNGRLETFTGPWTALSNATYRGGAGADLGWDSMTADGPARLGLQFQFYFNGELFLVPAQAPIRTLGDAICWTLAAEYDQPLPHGSGVVTGETNETISLVEFRDPRPSDALFEYTFVVTNGSSNIVIQTAYWLDSPDIYTGLPRLIGNITTRIAGLTAEPIELKGFFSQTFTADHYYFSERFIFEPRLEPGLSAAIVDELRAADIRLLLFTREDNIPRLQAMGFDGRIRDFAGGK